MCDVCVCQIGEKSPLLMHFHCLLALVHYFFFTFDSLCVPPSLFTLSITLSVSSIFNSQFCPFLFHYNLSPSVKSFANTSTIPKMHRFEFFVVVVIFFSCMSFKHVFSLRASNQLYSVHHRTKYMEWKFAVIPLLYIFFVGYKTTFSLHKLSAN